MALPNLPDRKPMFDNTGYPTTPTRVWWQAVKRALDDSDTTITRLRAIIDEQQAAIDALDARVTALETP